MLSPARGFVALALPCLLAAQDGFRPVFGGLPGGAGLAVGMEYNNSSVARGPVGFRAMARGSVRRYEQFEVELGLPRLARGWVFTSVEARYRNFPEEDFWGLGPASSRDLRTTFRLEDFDTTAVFGVRPLRWLQGGVSGGKTRVNTGPGKDGDFPSIEQIFSPSQAPALDRQADYFHWGAFLRADRRDAPDDPRSGGSYEFRWTSFHDDQLGRFDFHRYEIDLRHFVSCFEDRDTIAARGLVTFSQKRAGQQVPYFLQPSAGGGGDVRGYGHYRFRDENALVLNLEYRWRVREMFHAVLFADAGRVFHQPSQYGLSGLKGSAGVGGRVKLGERILLGLDLGWSPEGPRLWFRGSHAF
jgi:hypothetical protein